MEKLAATWPSTLQSVTRCPWSKRLEEHQDGQPVPQRSAPSVGRQLEKIDAKSMKTKSC